MPRRRTSRKKRRADTKKHQRNLTVKKQLKKTIKQFQSLISGKKLAEAKAVLVKVFSQLDKAAKKRIIHPATANRKKSRLAILLKKLGPN